MKLYIDGVGLLGPGLSGWTDGKTILAGRAPYCPAEVRLAPSALLPAAERRRMTDIVKLALAVGNEALPAGFASRTRTIFTSSGGDGATITAILETLATEQREVSPTRFHNSVHNAPAGYWGIAAQSREASISLCAHDFSFAAGLIEALAQALTQDQPVLLIAYDVPYSGALGAVRPLEGICGIALLVSARRSDDSIAAMTLALTRSDKPDTPMTEPALDRLRTGTPAARGLPLLAALARETPSSVVLRAMAGNVLEIDVVPVELDPA
ncbi:MAG TPA: beta-ketoacyl synthase chain length factor [Magnetospirillaceae bacterium]|nr:beta-ketoacyl synthase chain length factor [Magnetospirillaceae bacterium]